MTEQGMPRHRCMWPRSRIARAVIAACIITAAGIALGGTKPSTLDVQTGPIRVEAHPIARFDRGQPDARRFGKLTWRGGLVLTSPAKNFGGWSGLIVDSTGKGYFAVSDAGTWMSGNMDYDGAGKLTGLSSVRLGPIQSESGQPLLAKRDSDAEGLALLSGTPQKGSVLISFERRHRIASFDLGAKGLSEARSYIALPAGAKRMTGNGGFEAIAVLPGGTNKGSLVAITESLRDGNGNRVGWIWIKGKPERFQLANVGGFDITDAAPLPDGGLLVLERRFRLDEGVKMRLRLIRQHQLQPGATIAGDTLVETDDTREIDNMEGLAVHAGPAGEIIVTMISDDNFNRALQRTILLQFTLSAGVLATSE